MANEKITEARQRLAEMRIKAADMVWMAQQELDRALHEVQAHEYTSTACQHSFHSDCRLRCKWCDSACVCGCH